MVTGTLIGAVRVAANGLGIGVVGEIRERQPKPAQKLN